MSPYTPEQWFNQAEAIYTLLSDQISAWQKEEIDNVALLKAASGYQFFRMLRGEGFYEHRPAGIGEYQDRLYDMEKKLLKQVEGLLMSAVSRPGIDPDFIVTLKQLFWL